jgi:tetratricopeptide (TPR) repeat protein
MGKSALTWTWWNEIAPNEMKPLAGRMWWSFYESDARLENFTARALTYLTARPRTETEKIPMRDREDQLLAILDREPHLVVLDGLERELVAYARMDAAHLADDDLDARTAHKTGRRTSLPDTAAQPFVGEPKLRQTTDPRTGHFLRRLTQVRATRILVTTRLFPHELEDFNGEPLRGTSLLPLSGLSDDDALTLWRSAGITGARDALVPLFQSFEGHPLLVRALAGEISRDRKSPGDFDQWKERHPDFNPFALPLVQRESHVLAYSLEGLGPDELALLRTIAGFRMPAAYETLAALLVGDDVTRLFSSEEVFDRSLADLDDRGLVGWDRRSNRYDLHPIVRGAVWNSAGDGERHAIAERMRTHFEPMRANKWEKVERLDDLAAGIELYVSLIRLGRFDQAFKMLRDKLTPITLYRLSASRESVELLLMLFPDGIEQPPRLLSAKDQGRALNEIAQGYVICGQPRLAVPCFRRAISICEGDGQALSKYLCNLSGALRSTGRLHEAEASAVRALGLARATRNALRESLSLHRIGQSRVTRGLADGDVATRSAVRFGDFSKQVEGVGNAFLAQSALWRGDPIAAGPLADRAWDLACVRRHERDFIRVARLQGEAALALGDQNRADERLHHALARARAVNHVGDELLVLTPLAILYFQRGDNTRAREHLDSVWDASERGSYPLLHADARNLLAEIEIHEKNREAAVAAATTAYRLAWCDGPPFAYDFGLRTALAHLQALGAPEPEMPPYDASKHEPIEEIPIDPDETPAA